MTISYNINYKIPNYVGYYITKDFTKGNVNRSNYVFYYDSSIPYKYRTYSYNYSNTGYDRGHMSPAADWKFNKNAMFDSFSMANICPQSPALNRTYWNEVETIERKCTSEADTIFVISGSIVNTPVKHIKNNIAIPSKFYKTIVGIKNHKVCFSYAWIFNNDNSKQIEKEHRVTIQYIEKLINKDLYNKFWFNGKY